MSKEQEILNEFEKNRKYGYKLGRASAFQDVEKLIDFDLKDYHKRLKALPDVPILTQGNISGMIVALEFLKAKLSQLHNPLELVNCGARKSAINPMDAQAKQEITIGSAPAPRKGCSFPRGSNKCSCGYDADRHSEYYS